MGWPIGTPDEIKAVGLNPNKVESCAPANRRYLSDGELQEESGCQFWRRKNSNNQWIECLFARDCPAVNPKQGPTKAFRGTGPRNIALYRRLDETEIRPGEIVPPSFIQFTQCFLFEATQRDSYENQRATGERMAVVGVEGDGQLFPQTSVRDVENPADPKGPKLRQKFIEMLPIPPFERPAARFKNVELDRMAAAAVSGQRDSDIVQELADYMKNTIGEAEVPEPEKPKEHKSGRKA